MNIHEGYFTFRPYKCKYLSLISKRYWTLCEEILYSNWIKCFIQAVYKIIYSSSPVEKLVRVLVLDALILKHFIVETL